MSFIEIEREVEALTPEEQRKLMARLAALELQRDADMQKELSRRLNDRSPGAWIPLEEVERRLGLKP